MGTQEAREADVTIQGQRLRIQTTLDQQELEEIVAYAAERLKECQEAGYVSRYEAALVALLAVVEELFRERKALQSLKERIRMKSALILDMLGGEGGSNISGDDPPAGGI